MRLSSIQITNTNCPLCESSERESLYEVFDHEYKTTDDKFPLNKCKACDLIYLSPRPNLKSLDIIYPENYSNFHTGDQEESYVRKISNKLQSRSLKKFIEKYVAKNKFTVLDVGCGDGFILDRIKDVFPDSKTFGVEPNLIAARYASRRHNVFEGLIEKYKSSKKFDLIVSSHVVEHLEDPVGFIKKLNTFLKEDGVMIIDTPNIDCFQSKLFTKNWGGIHAPRHWTLFSIKTMAELAKKAGVKVLAIHELPINIYWIWSIHSWLYQKPKLRNFADKYMNTVDCVSSKSFYYLALMFFAEVLERITGLLKLGLGQQRAILRKL
jgi:2-polyprenyl-3-methyl-5-hydroxy-6-metoxy-1,4-benzoquinol methylase